MRARIAIPGLLLTLLAAGTLGAGPLYRYTNDEGVAVVAYQVPPEHVAKGYEVLNEKGVIIDVVPRSLSESERSSMNAEERRARQSAEERKRLQEWDRSLLLRYSTVADIEAARDRALRDLRIRVSILKGKQRSLRQQVENYQAQAADQERRDQAVNPAHLQAIEDLRREMGQTERSIVERKREISEVVASYERDIERFRTLLEVVELRRAMARATAPAELPRSGRVRLRPWRRCLATQGAGNFAKETFEQEVQLRRPVRRGAAAEAAAHELGHTPLGAGHKQVCRHRQRQQRTQALVYFRVAQHLPELGLVALEQLHHALVQARVLAGEGVTGHDAGNARVVLDEAEQKPQHMLTARGGCRLLAQYEGDALEEALLDELDEPLKHLRFAGKMAVEGRLGDSYALGELRRGDAVARVCLKHLCQRLKDLLSALGLSSRHGRGLLLQGCHRS